MEEDYEHNWKINIGKRPNKIPWWHPKIYWRA